MTSYVLFVDTKPARGGGQVVLERLISGVDPSRVGLFTSDALRSLLQVDPSIRRWTSPVEVLGGLSELRPNSIRVVGNATSDFGRATLTARALRRAGHHVRSIAILHNYPKDRLRSHVTRQRLRRFDQTIVVEPGLLRLAPASENPPWLSVSEYEVSTAPSPGDLTPKRGTVKVMARPDRSKGLHLLPAIFSDLSSDGVDCRVALGDALEQDRNYVSDLRRRLAPWLVDGRRTSDWLAPGDILLVPSISGEAACLTAQEAMLRGCAVVASRVGLMPYLAPTGAGVRTFAVANTMQAVTSVRVLMNMSENDFTHVCLENAATARSRAGLWYSEVRNLLFGG